MKILQINNVYKRGSTGKIVADIHGYLQEKNIESVVCYGRLQYENESFVYKTSPEFLAKLNALRARISGLQYNGAVFSTNKIIKIIKEEKPDIVHLQCINGYFVNIYRLVSFLKELQIKTVLTLHAEFMHTGSCGHAFECEKWKTGCGECPQLWEATKSYWFDRTNLAWRKMKNSFDDFKNLEVVSVSRWLNDRAIESPILKKHSFNIIHNGIDTDNVFKPSYDPELKEKLEIRDEKIILYITPHFSLNENDIKGGHYVVKLAELLGNKNVKIILIGNKDKSIQLPRNVIDIGHIYNQKELAKYYTMADLTLLTSKRETYSMVSVESLSCGTPVVGFKAGAPETIAIEHYSEFVNFGDLDSLHGVILKWFQKSDYGLKDKISGEARLLYSKEKMGKAYLDIYEKLYNL